MATLASLEAVQKAYIAYYGRPADPAGLEYWAGRADAEGMEAIIDAFGNSAEANDLFGGMSTADMLNTLYNQIFGRDADPEGLAFYTAELDAGRMTPASIALNIIDGAQGGDATIVANKVAVANDFTNALDTVEEQAAYNADSAATVRSMLATVGESTNVSTFNGVESTISQISNPNSVFTLTENMSEGTAPVTELYWGYNPNATEDDNSTEGPQDGGIPVSDLIEFVTTITGLDLFELGLVDDDGNGPFDNVSSLSLGDVFQGDNSTGTLTVGFLDGTSISAEAHLGEEYMTFLNNLLFDSEGNSRLYENEVTEGTDPALVPIILTPSENNGGTEELGYTSSADDLIVAGRLELLHGAYIDAGAGENTLEIDAKGHFAQPKQLLNIQHINVQNLPNAYTADNDDNTNEYPDVQEDAGVTSSIIDLSRAVDIETLTVTEGGFEGLDGNATPGTLTLAGIRNGAVTTLDGGFTQDVTLHFSEATGDGISLVFNNLSMGDELDDQNDPVLNVAHNAETLNIESTGAGNFLHMADLGGLLSNLNISGDAKLFIKGDLDASFHDDTPVTIDASANTGGVDLTLSGSEQITFIGTSADDRLDLSSSTNENGGPFNDAFVNIVGGEGDNYYEVSSYNATITNGDGNNNYEVDATMVSITAGNGENVVEVTATESAEVVLGDGGNTVIVEAPEATITTGAGDDNITVKGTDGDYTPDSDFVADGDAADGALIVIDAGTGSDVIQLGADDDVEGTNVSSITAKQGSSITGEDITLMVNTTADLRAAELNGITSVVLDDDNAANGADNSDNNSNATDGNKATLTLTAEQFLAIGAENFSVEGSVFSTHSYLKLIISEDTSLTDLGVDNLPRGIDLFLEVQDGAELTMTAEQLHTKVAQNGITLADDENTDYANGSVVINGGGINFDPFNTSDTVKTVIGGTTYFGGSLSDDFDTHQVTVNSVFGGYDRPADAENIVVLTIDADTTPEVAGFDTWHSNVEIVGNQDVTFDGALNLGLDSGVNDTAFTIDYSELEGEVVGLTLGNFENVGAVHGNSNNGYESVVYVELDEEDAGNDMEDAGSANQGLVSTGVTNYVVTKIGTDLGQTETGTIWLCDTTQDLELITLVGNYDDILEVENAAWGLNFELQGGGTAKSEGPTGTANVGTLDADFEWPNNPAASVNIVHSVEGDTRPIAVDGIVVDNTLALAITSEGPAVTIESLSANQAESLTLTAEGDVTIESDLPGTLESFDASAVAGDLTVTVDSVAEGFTFVGAAGSTDLTIDGAADGEIASIDGAGEIALTIGDTTDLSATTLNNVTTVAIEEGEALTLTMEQADVIGAENFSIIDTNGNGVIDGSTSLTLEGLNDQPFALGAYPEDLNISVTLAEVPVVTLHPDTDLTGIASLVIPEGTTLELTAAQFQQLDNNGGAVLTGSGSVHITDMTQADVGENGEDLDLTTINLSDDGLGGKDGIATVTVTLAEDVDLSDSTAHTTDTGAGTFDAIVDTFNIGDFTLVLSDVRDAHEADVIGGETSVLRFADTYAFWDDDADNQTADVLHAIDASGFDVKFVELLNVLVGSDGINGAINVDELLSGLPSTQDRNIKVVYNGEGWAMAIDQVVDVTAGTTLDASAAGSVIFNTLAPDTEIANFTVNLEGGNEILGDLVLNTTAKFNDIDGDGVQGAGENDLMRLLLQTLTINSDGDGSAPNLLTGEVTNVITGSISPLASGAGTTDNNLKSVTINATQALEITGDIIFESVTNDDQFVSNDDDEATVSLTVNGTADVTVGQLDMSDVDIDTLSVTNNGTGTLTVTGASPAIITGAESEGVVLSGTGDMVFSDADAGTNNTTVDSDSLSLIDASGLSGDLALGELENVDNADFSFIAGSGVTTVTLTDEDLDSTGVDTIAGNDDDTAGWSFDFSNAAAGSEFHLAPAAEAFVAGSVLNIDLGANTTLYIDETMDLSDLDLSITQTQNIVVADGATLTLSAEQANGLNIVGENGTDSTGVVNVVNLGSAATDLSGISADVAGVVTINPDDNGDTVLENDVTLDVTTDLGAFTVQLTALDDADDILSGQTIRFTTVEQAERAIQIADAGGDIWDPLTDDLTGDQFTNSTNVVWLFDNIVDPVDTVDYSSSIGRLWITDDLIANYGGNVEDLFTTLTQSILRAEFADADLLNALLSSNGFDRTFEVVSFLELGDITFSDIGVDPDEFVETLTVKMGGQSTIDSIMLDDEVNDPDYDPASVAFQTLTIESHRSLSDDYFLAAEAYTNDNDGTVVPGEHVLPNNINTIGDISSGAGLDLLDVNIDTLSDSVALEGANSVVGATPGADLSIQTIFFDSDTAGSAATFDITGENDVTVKSLDTSDAEVTSLAITNSGTGSLTITGGSPAFDGGMAAGNTETLTITTTDGDVSLGTEMDTVNGVPYAGVAGEELSTLTVTTNNGDVDLGTIAMIDSSDDDTDADTIPDQDAFTLTGTVNGTGSITARLGTANVDGNLVAPTLDAGSTWNFDGIDLTIAEGTTVNGTLDLNDVALTIEGNVDLTNATLVLTGTTTIEVPAGETLTLTIDQLEDAGMIDITGEGTVIVTGEVDTDGAAADYTLELAHVKTVNVDLSNITNAGSAPQANNVVINLPATATEDDGVTAAGFNVVGTDFNDSITGSALDDTFTMGAGDDTIDGGTGNDTFNVDAGTDTITSSLVNDGTDGDVLVVSAGATANATVDAADGDFIATAATMNDGTATITGVDGQDNTIDVSAAGGANGFSLVGGDGLDTLSGSNQDDTINGGAGGVAGEMDVLTGNGGADTFVFEIQQSTPIELTQETTTDGEDYELWQFDADGDGFAADNDGVQGLTVFYRNNDTATSFTINDDASINFEDGHALGARVATELTARGVAASYDAGTGELSLTGTAGQSVEITSFTPAGGGAWADAAPAELLVGAGSDADDVAQETEVTVAAGNAIAGEIYSITVTLAEGSAFTYEFNAVGGEDQDAIAAALAAGIDALDPGAQWTAGAAGAVVTITDDVEDNGGFTVDLDNNPGISGTGASALGAGNGVWAAAEADTITDFVSGVDSIQLGLAGTNANYLEGAEEADYADAFAAADAVMDGTVRYYLTSATDFDGVGAGTEGGGLLFFDANGDSDIDGVIVLTGITQANFDETDIIA
jgi:hypothetical protein